MFTSVEIRYPESIAFFVSMEEVFRQEKDILPGRGFARAVPVQNGWI
jgi:hypothetical protein